MGTREGLRVAKAKGGLQGKKPKLSPSQEQHLYQPGENTSSQLAELFSVARSTVCGRGRRRRRLIPAFVP